MKCTNQFALELDFNFIENNYSIGSYSKQFSHPTHLAVGVLAPGYAHARPSAQDPIDKVTSNFCVSSSKYLNL